MNIDLKIIEEGNGGELQLNATDLALVFGYENMPYLAMFGGNVSGNWWGNDLLLADQPDKQFVSLTERTLMQVALNSSGRIKIEEAAMKDLEFLRDAIPGISIKVTAIIVSDDVLELNISINGKEAIFKWDGELELVYISPEFLSQEIIGILLSQNGTDYFIPE